MPAPILDASAMAGTLVGRVWRNDKHGPAVVTLRDGMLSDITSVAAPTVSALLQRPDALDYVKTFTGEAIGKLEAVAAASDGRADADTTHFLAPCDLQAIKACGVTFAQSMVERVIEEKAAGNADRAAAIRQRIGSLIGDSLANLKAGSEEAARVKQALIAEGVWSQYLEVGIGPDAEVFTKSPVLSAVGWGAEIGIHSSSSWNNPEPEIVLAVNSQGQVKGASLGNDVNLRDIEGRSALLLGKAKDNNASCAIGPFIRLFDQSWGLDDVRQAQLQLTVKGEDGFVLDGHSAMNKISRDPLDLVAQTCGQHHQYPDGFMLFLGTLFAPTKDREAPGQGFTHKLGDEVTISATGLGALRNVVRHSHHCAPWTFGVSALMKNLAARGLL